jgi:DUF2934 family protein
MRLINHFKPLLELASCKEYCMARRTTGNSTYDRSKKAPSTPTPAMQVVADARKNVVPISLEDEIRKRAYEIYVGRGCTPGSEHDDWFAAEREIRSRYSRQQHTA